MSDDSSWGRLLLGILAITVCAVCYLFWPLIANTPEHQADTAIDEAVWSCQHQRGYNYYQRVYDARRAIGKLELKNQAKFDRKLDESVTKAGCSLKTPEEQEKEEVERWQKNHGSGSSPDSGENDSNGASDTSESPSE